MTHTEATTPTADEQPGDEGSGATAAGVAHRTAGPALLLAALGIVFGDIGTSPLYALQTVFSIDNGAVRPDAGRRLRRHLDDRSGRSRSSCRSSTSASSCAPTTTARAASWRSTALARRLYADRAERAGPLVVIGILGVSLFYGDSLITPAISVLSAVEGVRVAAPGLGHVVVPVAAVILTVLFVAQRFGTGQGRARCSARSCCSGSPPWPLAGRRAGSSPSPACCRGSRRRYAVLFVVDHPFIAFVAMGAVVLVITGAEALYADMGHFGRPPILRAWFFVVFPALTLNYLGQASLILRHPAAVSNPFFLLRARAGRGCRWSCWPPPPR